MFLQLLPAPAEPGLGGGRVEPHLLRRPGHRLAVVVVPDEELPVRPLQLSQGPPDQLRLLPLLQQALGGRPPPDRARPPPAPGPPGWPAGGSAPGSGPPFPASPGSAPGAAPSGAPRPTGTRPLSAPPSPGAGRAAPGRPPRPHRGYSGSSAPPAPGGPPGAGPATSPVPEWVSHPFPETRFTPINTGDGLLVSICGVFVGILPTSGRPPSPRSPEAPSAGPPCRRPAPRCR